MKKLTWLLAIIFPLNLLAQDANYNWSNTRFSAAATQAKRYKVARVYYNAIHWGNYPSIQFSLRQENYSSGEIDYLLTVQPGGASIACTKAYGISVHLGRMIIGAETATGITFSNEPNYYRDIFLDVAYYSTWHLSANVVGTGFAFDKTSITSGEYNAVTLFTSPAQENIVSFNDTKNILFSHQANSYFKVGIGTESPAGKVHIVKTTTVDNDVTLAIDGPVNSERALGFYDNGTLSWWFGRDNNTTQNLHDAIGFQKPGVGTVMALKDNGQVTIGTAVPLSDAKLSVNGSVAAQKVKVTMSGWADHVFEKDYPLPTLRQLEQYLRANKHLPGIPSASEVEKDGVDLGEMNKKLLQKIEELTLHLIEQNKRLEALEKENAAMKKK